MSSRFYSWLLSSAFAGIMFSMTGCGGGDTTVATTTPATTPAQTPAAASPPAESTPPSKQQSSYAGEQKGANSGGGGGPEVSGSMGMGGETYNEEASGGGPGGGGGRSGPSGGPPGPGVMSGGMGRGGYGDVGSGGNPGTGPGMNPGAGPGMPDMPMPGMGLGGAGAMPGAGAGMGMEMGSEGDARFGQPGFGQPGLGDGSELIQLTTFLRESCVSCHSSGNAKGGVVLDQVGSDLKSNAQLWSRVVDALESSSMPPKNARQPDASRKAAVINLIQQALGGSGSSGSAEKSFMDRAEMAFRKGDHEKAMSLFYAQLITADNSEASELANHFKLYKPSPKEADKLTPANDAAVAVKPKLVTGLNLAVGVLLKVGQGVTEVKPVGVSQAGGAGGGMGEGAPSMGTPGMGGRGSGAGGGNVGMSKMESFEDLTGDIGLQIVSSFDSRRAAGKYGTLFSSISHDTGSSFGGGLAGAGGFEAGNDFGGGLGAAGMGGGPGGRGAGPGMGGMGLAGGPGGRGPGGMAPGGMAPGGMAPGGMAPGGMAPGGMAPGGEEGGMGMGGGMGMSGVAPRKTMAGKNLANGLLYIGKGDSANTLFKKAMEAGVDGLIIVEVEANKNMRTGIVTNDTRFRFMLPSGKVVATSSKTIKNTEVEIKQDTEIVQKQVDAMFNQMDSVLNVVDLPQISAASAMKQLHSKIHANGDRLQILAEARMYHAKGIISNDQLETVYQVVLEGNEGVALANGTADDKKLVMTSFTEKL